MKSFNIIKQIPKSTFMHSNFVKYFWQIESSVNEESTFEIYPSGCIEIVFNLGSEYQSCIIDDNKLSPNGNFYVYGQTMKGQKVQQTGRTKTFGVRMHPYGAYPFLNRKLSRLYNRRVPISWLLGNYRRSLVCQIINAKNFDDRVRLITSWFNQKLSSINYKEFQLCKSLVNMIISNYGNITTMQMALKSGINRKKIERLFNHKIGLSPGKFRQIVRFQKFLYELSIHPELSLTELAYISNYSDQAHLSREFKIITGKSPRHYLKKLRTKQKTGEFIASRLF